MKEKCCLPVHFKNNTIARSVVLLCANTAPPLLAAGNGCQLGEKLQGSDGDVEKVRAR